MPSGRPTSSADQLSALPERAFLLTPSCSCALPWPERDGGRRSCAASQRVPLRDGPRSDVVRTLAPLAQRTPPEADPVISGRWILPVFPSFVISQHGYGRPARVPEQQPAVPVASFRPDCGSEPGDRRASSTSPQRFPACLRQSVLRVPERAAGGRRIPVGEGRRWTTQARCDPLCRYGQIGRGAGGDGGDGGGSAAATLAVSKRNSRRTRRDLPLKGPVNRSRAAGVRPQACRLRRQALTRHRLRR